MKNDQPGQITEELKQSEVQEDQGAEISDESLEEEQVIDELNDKPSNKNEVTIQGLEQKL